MSKTKRKCIVCHVNPPEVPDRERMGRPIKRVCGPCHRARLQGDFEEVLRVHRLRIVGGLLDGVEFE